MVGLSACLSGCRPNSTGKPGGHHNQKKRPKQLYPLSALYPPSESTYLVGQMKKTLKKTVITRPIFKWKARKNSERDESGSIPNNQKLDFGCAVSDLVPQNLDPVSKSAKNPDETIYDNDTEPDAESSVARSSNVLSDSQFTCNALT